MSCKLSVSPFVGLSTHSRYQPFRNLSRPKPRRQLKAGVSARQALEIVYCQAAVVCRQHAISCSIIFECVCLLQEARISVQVCQHLSLTCRQENKSATEQAPRHPPQPLQQAAESLSGKQTSDDGRVVRGSSRPSKDGTGGRFYLNVTGFPFPLGPLFARQTVRTEVMLLLVSWSCFVYIPVLVLLVDLPIMLVSSLSSAWRQSVVMQRKLRVTAQQAQGSNTASLAAFASLSNSPVYASTKLGKKTELPLPLLLSLLVATPVLSTWSCKRIDTRLYICHTRLSQ